MAVNERAHKPGALSCFCLNVIFWLIAPAAATECVIDRIDATAPIAHVYDGDTVQLGDGQRLRLIGIDTPELGRHGQPDQSLAAMARDALRQRLPRGSVIRLRYDIERHDAHGRRLAHGFFKEGDSASVWLLEQGLATLMIIPPDFLNAECYAAAERRAREARRGLWSLPEYQPVAADALPRDAQGYRVVRGQVLKAHATPQAFWLHLEAQVAVRIAHDDLPYFSSIPLHEAVGREVVVRGWVRAVGESLHLTLRYPTHLEWPIR